jgi:hypothetical protein
MIRAKLFMLLAGMVALSFMSQARADLVQVTFSGPDVSGSLNLTYGAVTDSTYSDAFEVTGISGTFTDSSLGITNAQITSLIAITRDAPEAKNLLAPNDFSKFPVASGLNFGTLSFDNLFWPNGSPQTASDYTNFGGFLDIYGLLFSIGGNKVVNFWSNGDVTGTGAIDYGVAVATADEALHYVDSGVTATIVPEPASLALLGSGCLILLAGRRKCVA